MNDDVNEVRGFSYISIEKVETSDPFSTGFTYYTHGTRVVAVSPDGKWIAFGGWDETIQVCELVAGWHVYCFRKQWGGDCGYSDMGSNNRAGRLSFSE